MSTKIHIRTLWPDLQKRRTLWTNDNQRDALRNYLNDIGFYVLSGAGDSLEVYAIDYSEPADIFYLKKVLALAEKSWYAMKGGK